MFEFRIKGTHGFHKNDKFQKERFHHDGILSMKGAVEYLIENNISCLETLVVSSEGKKVWSFDPNLKNLLGTIDYEFNRLVEWGEFSESLLEQTARIWEYEINVRKTQMSFSFEEEKDFFFWALDSP